MSNNYIASVDLGGTNIRVALFDFNGNIVARSKVSTGEDPLQTLFGLLESVFAANSADVAGLGLAVAGLIDREKGIILGSPNIPQLNGVSLKSEIEKRYSMRIVIENDANAAAYGEKLSGAGKNIRNFVMLTLGTGIGAGIIFNDKLLPVAAEIGH